VINIAESSGFGLTLAKEIYAQALHDNRTIVSRCVTYNLLDRHMKPLFLLTFLH